MNQEIILVSGPVIVEDDKVLLNQHGDTNFWKFCGGSTKDFNTRLTKIAERKVLDEMGIKINILNENPFIQYTAKNLETGIADVILVHFLAERIGEIQPREDIRDWKWIPLKDLETEDLAPNIIPALRHFNFIK